MVWQYVTFERDALYKEVWAEPVRIVALRYGISDVELRRICARLGVPLPPLGYWARVAAGQKPRVTALPAKHKGETRYVRQVHVDEQADERSTRVQTLLSELSPPKWPAIVVKVGDAELLPVVERTSSRISARTKKAAGLLESRGDDALDIQVTEAQKGRALRIADAVISALLRAGATLVPRQKKGSRVHLDVLGEHVELRIEELLGRSLRAPTEGEKARQKRESWYKPDLLVLTPTGKLKLTIFNPKHFNPFLTATDGAIKPLEQRLDDIVPRLWTRLAELRVKAQMAAEEHDRWREREALRAARETARRSELDRLEQVEATVKQWARAAALRRYADALERSQKHEPEAVAWIRNAADWLDPLVRKHWDRVSLRKTELSNDNGQ